mmetsp:Transcript_125595/g.227828  ORF Transcript_125595/g.227828 Transcript_125595/m.227828 type:complete len:220 (+) Transcript_125595:1817-2476(+)
MATGVTDLWRRPHLARIGFTMSFAASLQSRTAVANQRMREEQPKEAQRRKEEEQRKIDECADNILAQFADKCSRQADKGEAICVWIDSKTNRFEACLMEKLMHKLKESLATMGFPSFAVTNEENNSFFMTPDFENNCLILYQSVRIKISAFWDDVAQQNETSASGSEVQCPVCLETRPGVALVPCGHTVCRACASRLSMSACPSCRRLVTGCTSGLFIS